jgi:hypothetical protein
VTTVPALVRLSLLLRTTEYEQSSACPGRLAVDEPRVAGDPRVADEKIWS